MCPGHIARKWKFLNQMLGCFFEVCGKLPDPKQARMGNIEIQEAFLNYPSCLGALCNHFPIFPSKQEARGM